MQKFPQLKRKHFLLTGSLFFLAALLLQLTARFLPGFGEWYGVRVYPFLVGSIGRFSGQFSFSVVEFGLYALLVTAVIYGIRHIRKPLDLAAGAFFVLSLLAFSYTANCGVNYYRCPFSSFLNLEIRNSSEEELTALCRFLAGEVEKSAREVQEGKKSIVPDKKACRHFAGQAKEDMENLGQHYEQLSGFYPKPKMVAVSEILSYQSLSGIYSPFTIEANVNQDMAAYNIPHTACHELSHLKGFMREEEANFIGYLACTGSKSPYSRYSGYLAGFIYANNALYRQNKKTAQDIYNGLPESVLEDLHENTLFWRQYEGRIAEVSAQVNDTYLKVNSQEDGVKSYGRMVDLLLAYYR